MASIAPVSAQKPVDGTTNAGGLAVPAVVCDWLPKQDDWQNSVHRFLFWLPEQPDATERRVPLEAFPARSSAIDLALEFQGFLDEGVVNNRADIAERYGVSRARVAQVLNLLRLPAAVLSLLADSGGAVWSERQLCDVLRLPSDREQIAAVMAMSPKPVEADSQPA